MERTTPFEGSEDVDARQNPEGQPTPEGWDSHRGEDPLIHQQARVQNRASGTGNRQPAGPPADFVSESGAMDQIWKVIDRVSATDVPVLIRGESGVGKDVVARTLHTRSPRRSKPFLKINCAALPANLLESELFGYQRGAFTGANSDTKGKFELADEGTLFLDEIGEMPTEMQAKLLQVLQDGEYFRVGGSRSIRVNTRVVVATNRDLEAEIAAGRFRGDLYYRLNVVSVRVPALRERPEDIPALISHFVRKYAERYESTLDELPPEAMKPFLNYSWPGNVRELENLIRRMVVLGDVSCILEEIGGQEVMLGSGRDYSGGVKIPGSLLDSAQASAEESQLSSSRPSAGFSTAAEALEWLGVFNLQEAKDELALKEVAQRAQIAAEREAITHMLRRTCWNKRQAAIRLKISYKALLYKIKECGIVDPRVEAGLEGGS